jgi:hypothetical protein
MIVPQVISIAAAEWIVLRPIHARSAGRAALAIRAPQAGAPPQNPAPSPALASARLPALPAAAH